MDGHGEVEQRHDREDRPVGPDCLFACAPGAPALCDVEWCCCGCHDDARRATEADDRPDDKLHVVANDLEREARPDPRDLTAERFGAGRRP